MQLRTSKSTTHIFTTTYQLAICDFCLFVFIQKNIVSRFWKKNKSIVFSPCPRYYLNNNLAPWAYPDITVPHSHRCFTSPVYHSSTKFINFSIYIELIHPICTSKVQICVTISQLSFHLFYLLCDSIFTSCTLYQYRRERGPFETKVVNLNPKMYPSFEGWLLVNRKLWEWTGNL